MESPSEFKFDGVGCSDDERDCSYLEKQTYADI